MDCHCDCSSGSQDFTGVPAVVDLACMRDAMNNLKGDSNKINPLVSYIYMCALLSHIGISCFL